MRKISSYTNARPGPIRLGKRSFTRTILIYFAIISLLAVFSIVISYNVLSIKVKLPKEEYEAKITTLQSKNDSLEKENKELKKLIDELKTTPSPTPTPSPKPTATPKSTQKVTNTSTPRTTPSPNPTST